MVINLEFLFIYYPISCHQERDPKHCRERVEVSYVSTIPIVSFVVEIPTA